MSNATEPKYYKIIGPTFCFRDICPYDIDVLHIPYGTTFTSPFEPQGDEYDQDEHWNLDPAYIHFAKGGFSTILWYNWLFQKRHIQNNQIYRIQPLDMIVCDRCIDKAQLFQWGSNSIQILEKCNLKEMYAMALQEYRANKPAFARDYAHLKLQQIIKALEKGARFPIQTR